MLRSNRKRKVLEAKIASLQEEFDRYRMRLNKSYVEEELKKEINGKEQAADHREKAK